MQKNKVLQKNNKVLREKNWFFKRIAKIKIQLIAKINESCKRSF